MKHYLAEVTWNDAQDLGNRQSWMTVEEIKEAVEREEVLVRSVGWHLGRHKNHIMLASSYSPAATNSEHDDYGTIQLIPAGWVKSIRRLR